MGLKSEIMRPHLSHFGANAILRGVQLTLVGAIRALQNPNLWSSQHYKQVLIAIAAGIAIRFLISIPFNVIRIILWLISFAFDFENALWNESLATSWEFIQNYVLQIPFFLMTFMKYVTPTLDNLFMDSLAWVDYTYYKKHEGETPTAIREGYYHNLQQYTAENNKPNSMSTKTTIAKFIFRFGKRAGISLFIFACSYVPFVGRLVLPGASFYTFQKVIGFAPAAIIFGTGIFLPRRYLVIFLQSYFSSRSLTRELLEPYFIRIHFTKDQKRNWFFDREGLLFGFGVGFYLLLRIPLLGVLMYGIAEASTAYLVTKITDPPPIPAQSDGFAASQQKWANKHEFLRLNLREIDKQLRHKRFADTPPNTTTKKAKN